MANLTKNKVLPSIPVSHFRKELIYLREQGINFEIIQDDHKEKSDNDLIRILIFNMDSYTLSSYAIAMTSCGFDQAKAAFTKKSLTPEKTAA